MLKTLNQHTVAVDLGMAGVKARGLTGGVLEGVADESPGRLPGVADAPAS
jgi:hypothetical protein